MHSIAEREFRLTEIDREFVGTVLETERCVYTLFEDDFQPEQDDDVFVPPPGDHCVYGLFADDFDPAVDDDVFTCRELQPAD